MASRIVPPIIAVVLGAGTGVYIFSELTFKSPASFRLATATLTSFVSPRPAQNRFSNRTGSEQAHIAITYMQRDAS